MRKFKFRAWDDDKMFYQVRCGGTFDDIPTAPTAWDESRKDWVNLTGQPYTKIMQYTGLKDRNGKEIYEGDILDDYEDKPMHIEFSNKKAAFCFVDEFDPYGKEYYTVKDLHYEDLIIVGNIYENPELLEVCRNAYC